MKRDLSRPHPSLYHSVTVGSADQTLFDVPHFSTITKNGRNRNPKVRSTDAWEYSVDNHLHFYRMIQKRGNGDNLTVENFKTFQASFVKKKPRLLLSASCTWTAV